MIDNREQQQRLNAELARIVGEAFIAGVNLSVEIPLRFGEEHGEAYATRMMMVSLELFFCDQASHDFIALTCESFSTEAEQAVDLSLSVGSRQWSDGVTRMTAYQPEAHRGDAEESRWLALTHPQHKGDRT